MLNSLLPRNDNQKPNKNNVAIQFAQVNTSVLGESTAEANYQKYVDIEFNMKSTNSLSIETPLLEIDPRTIEGKYGTTFSKSKKVINGLEAG